MYSRERRLHLRGCGGRKKGERARGRRKARSPKWSLRTKRERRKSGKSRQKEVEIRNKGNRE
jgi:hypothetical protein